MPEQTLDVRDVRVLGRLYDELGPRLYHYLLFLLRGSEEAERALDRVFLHLYRKKKVKLPSGSLAGHVFGLARREAARERPAPGHATLFTDEGVSREERDFLESALDRIPKEHAEAFFLKMFGGLTFHEIAEALSVSLDEATGRYREGMQGVQRMLGMDHTP